MSEVHVLRMSAGNRAFTLIELLVVISIISLLVAILLPALASAREAGRTVQCLSNTRQLLMTWHVYSDDFRDWMVGWRNDTYRFSKTVNPPSVATTRYWPFMVKDYINMPDMPDSRLGQPAGWSKARLEDYYSRGLLSCPSLQFRITSPVAPHISMARYGIGGENWGSYHPVERRLEIHRPGEVIYSSDIYSSTTYSGYGSGAPWVDNSVNIMGHQRHNNRANYGFADGHAVTDTLGFSSVTTTYHYQSYLLGGGYKNNNK